MQFSMTVKSLFSPPTSIKVARSTFPPRNPTLIPSLISSLSLEWSIYRMLLEEPLRIEGQWQAQWSNISGTVILTVNHHDQLAKVKHILRSAFTDNVMMKPLVYASSHTCASIGHIFRKEGTEHFLLGLPNCWLFAYVFVHLSQQSFF